MRAGALLAYSVRRVAGLKPPSPLRACVSAGLKPVTPLRGGNAGFPGVVGSQWCCWFHWSPRGGVQWCRRFHCAPRQHPPGIGDVMARDTVGAFALHEALRRYVVGVSDPHVVQIPPFGGGEAAT